MEAWEAAVSCFNIKTLFPMYMIYDLHYRDGTVIRPSYLYDGYKMIRRDLYIEAVPVKLSALNSSTGTRVIKQTFQSEFQTKVVQSDRILILEKELK